MNDSFEKFDVKCSVKYKIFIAIIAPALIALGVYDLVLMLAGQDNFFIPIGVLCISSAIYYFLKIFLVKLNFENNTMKYTAWYGKKCTFDLIRISKVQITKKGNYSYTKIYDSENKIICRLESMMGNLNRFFEILKQQEHIKFI